MKQSLKLILFFILGILAAFLVMYFISDYKAEKNRTGEKSKSRTENHQKINEENFDENSIDNLTGESLVINYVKTNRRLPDYYLTKAEARNNGWVTTEGNLCDVLPGRAIGGDKFSNREKTLPKGNQYFEADVNYKCGRRNADRIVYTKNGDVWLTHDHYKTFSKQ